MNKIIITIVIITVVLVGGYFFFGGAYQPKSVEQQSPLQTSAGQPQTIEVKIVTYIDSGFSPGTLIIKKGDTVAFKNQSSQSMWTSSAAHPIHREYPTSGGCIGSTFDACKGIQPGNSWTFKFDIQGSWKYHNHLNPSNTGTIVVE